MKKWSHVAVQWEMVLGKRIAGIWERAPGPGGECIHSAALLLEHFLLHLS